MSAYGLKVENEGNAPLETPKTTKGFWKLDLVQLTILLGITFFSVYFTPPAANKILFLFFIPLAFRSEKDYFWLVWFFIINDAPGHLFSAKELHDLRIPIYTLAAGASIEFQELFLFVYVAKFLKAKEKFLFIFQKSFYWYFIVFGITLSYSFYIGINLDNIVYTVKAILPWTWLLIFPYFIRDPNDLVNASRLLFPFAFLALLFQIHSFITGDYLDNILRGEVGRLNLAIEEGGEAARSYSSVYLSIIAVTQALFYLASRKKIFNPNYLGAVIFSAAIAIFLSATRGYILSFGFLIIASFFIIARSGKIQRIFNIAIASIILVTILLLSFPKINRQITAATKRFSTIFLLASGDVTAGGTLYRIDVRGKRVMEKFNESPVVGWGFSNPFYDYSDSHVGLQNILLNVGVLGFLYLNLLFFYICLKIWLFSRDKRVRAKWKDTLSVYVYSLINIFIIHATTSQFWGFILYFDHTAKVITISFLIGAANALIITSLKESTPPKDESAADNKPVFLRP